MLAGPSGAVTQFRVFSLRIPQTVSSSPVASARVNWNSVEAIGTCVAAVGTVAAFAAQRHALKVERRTRQEEIARIDRDTAAAERARAAAVSLQITQYDEDPRYEDDDELVVHVGNHGPYPITNVVGRLLFHPAVGQPVRVDDDYDARDSLPFVAPNSSAVLVWSVPAEIARQLAGQLSPPQTESFSVEITFSDVHGGRWKINDLDRGKVVRVVSPAPPPRPEPRRPGGRLRATVKQLVAQRGRVRPDRTA